ncbi:MAG: diaminopimelate aminotransferase [Bdellovibrionales bacterium RIFOXYD1_FULL_53_11]|nr:MAG: diaminopimelate aminotransferase [Bdellovibrionales bacterium RIFOXYD1_FULL_53_11]
MEKNILDKIATYGDYAIELQRGLTAIPAISPSSGGEGEFDKALWLEAELRKLKFDDLTRIDCPQPEAKGGVRPNIIARYKGTGSSKTLWIMTHMDVVPPGELKLWKTDPYKLHVENGRLYGRGTEDNQQGLVASILTVRAMMECGYRPPVDIALLFNADEETGSTFGAGYVVNKHPEIFGKNDMFIVPDGGTPDATMIEVAEKSIMWLKIRTLGKQCHASTPEQGRNAFKAACELAVNLGALYKKFNKKDKLYDPPVSTFEPTKKEANVPNVNTIPGEDVFYLDSRVMPCYKLAEVKAEIKKHAKKIEKKHKVRISFESVQEGQAAPPTPSGSEIVKVLTESIKKIHKSKAKPMGIGGGTVAAFFRRLKLPAVVYSKQDEVMHQPNEYCILDNLIGDAKVFAVTAMNIKP